MNTYDEYLNTELSLSFDEMLQIHNDILAEIGSDETALDLYDDLLALENAGKKCRLAHHPGVPR